MINFILLLLIFMPSITHTMINRATDPDGESVCKEHREAMIKELKKDIIPLPKVVQPAVQQPKLERLADLAARAIIYKICSMIKSDNPKDIHKLFCLSDTVPVRFFPALGNALFFILGNRPYNIANLYAPSYNPALADEGCSCFFRINTGSPAQRENDIFKFGQLTMRLGISYS